MVNYYRRFRFSSARRDVMANNGEFRLASQISNIVMYVRVCTLEIFGFRDDDRVRLSTADVQFEARNIVTVAGTIKRIR